MNKLVVLFVLLLPACASGKGFLSGLFTAKVADEVKVADTVKGADKITGVEKVDRASLVDASKTTRTTVGGNQTNDSEVIKIYVRCYERIIAMLKKIIMALIGVITALISLLGWALKKAMNDNSDDDRFKEKLIGGVK